VASTYQWYPAQGELNLVTPLVWSHLFNEEVHIYFTLPAVVVGTRRGRTRVGGENLKSTLDNKKVSTSFQTKVCSQITGHGDNVLKSSNSNYLTSTANKENYV
jgi:hypothetical protein